MRWFFVHYMIMVGPPGAGKTLIARAVPGILPDLTLDEALEVTRIYSVADLLPSDTPMIRQRPFRAPHHTISHAGLVGGGKLPRPDEISLAHRGVLFSDKLPEFDQRSLEILRQPDAFVHMGIASPPAGAWGRAAVSVAHEGRFTTLGDYAKL